MKWNPTARSPISSGGRRAASGDRAAHEELLAAVYEDLRRLANQALARETDGGSIQPTVLVHDAYIGLMGGGAPRFDDRRHFFVVAARAMHRLLVDHARRRLAEKRGTGRRPLDITRLDVAAMAPPDELIALHEAVEQLDEEHRRIVELRFFVGLSMADTADALGLPLRTAERVWTLIRARLHRELSA